MDKSLGKALSKIITGYVFILFGIKIYVYFRPIDLLPDIAGYMFMLSGIGILSRYRPSAKLLEPLVSIMIMFEVAGIFDMIFTAGLYPDIYFVTVIKSCLYIYINFRLITEIIAAMEENGISTGNMIFSRNIILVTYTFSVISQQYSDLFLTTNSSIGIYKNIIVILTVVYFLQQLYLLISLS